MSDIEMDVETSLRILDAHIKQFTRKVQLKTPRTDPALIQVGYALVEIEYILKSLHEKLQNIGESPT